MSRAAADRNLLFGILAVQMDFVRADQLIAAMNAWVLDKGKALGAHLMDAGALAPETHALIVALVDRHIEQHGGRVEQSLAALSSVQPLRRELGHIADADVQTSLAHAGAPTPRGDRHATLATPQPQHAAGVQRFRILRPHAAGGLGKVSVARDAELNREVALKELHDRHADNPDSRARFLQEAEITGGLEHPGVVPIYGLGQYADGRPFYAMRFIRGDSLAQAIERFHRDADPKWSRPADMLQLRRLLGRFLDVCNAMEYAHSRGVLHRDLKPGNIMLGQYGETLVVDWGLAKPLGRAGGEDATTHVDATIPLSHEPVLTPQAGSGSAPTQMGSAIGTPAYMSPEQASGRLDKLGPASDVYSLGATLYVLLAGKAPQEDDDLGVVIQRVQRGEFPTPRSIKSAIPRNLEAICLKAMALNPEARYPSPRKLAEDVEAWLADEPVTARKEGPLARGRRWVKKHRTLVTSAAGTLIVGLVCLTVAIVLLDAAKKSAVEAKNRAQLARAEAERQTGRNEELLTLARNSLERYEKLSQSDQLSRYGMESLRSDLQEAAVEYYATLAKQSGESEQARADRGGAHFRLGTTYWQLGHIDEAQKALNQAVAIYGELEQEFPDDKTYPLQAAYAYASIGEILSDEQLATEAEAPLAESRKRLAGLSAADPNNVEVTMAMAYGASLESERLRQLGKIEEAAAAIRKGIEKLERVDLKPLNEQDNRDVRYRLAKLLTQLATLESQAMWKFDVARANYAKAGALLRALFQEVPDYGEVGHSLAALLGDSGDLDARENLIDAARVQYAEAVEVLAKVEQRQPDVPHYRQLMAELLHSLGVLHHPLIENTSDESLAQLEQAAAIGRRLAEQFPQEASRKLALARYESSLGAAYQERGREDESKAQFDHAVALLEEVSRQSGDRIDALHTLASMQFAIAEQLAEADRTADALQWFESTESSLERLAQLAPTFPEVHLSLANVFIQRSMCLGSAGRLVDAIEELDRLSVKSAQLREMANAEWMQSALKGILLLSKTGRWDNLRQIRDEGLNALTDRGDYLLAGEQARKLPALTGEASDHYVAARALAYAAQAAVTDEKTAEPTRPSIVEPLAADAVKHLTLAWEKGYLKRRSGGFSALLRSAATLKDVQESEVFAVLRQRADYAALVHRIETERPPSKDFAGTPRSTP